MCIYIIVFHFKIIIIIIYRIDWSSSLGIKIFMIKSDLLALTNLNPAHSNSSIYISSLVRARKTKLDGI